MHRRKLAKYLAPAVCLSLAQLAHAQESGGYIGAGLGTFEYDETGEEAFSDSTSTYKLVGGYRFNDHLAVEGGLARTGDLETSLEDEIFGAIELDMVLDIYDVRVMGYLPFDRLSLFAGVGYYSMDMNVTASVFGIDDIPVFDGHERGATAGAGVQYDFGLDLRSLSIRGEYEWFDVSGDVDTDAWAVRIGILYRF